MTNFWTKFEAFADHKIKVARMTGFVLEVEENIVGKRGNAE